MSYKEPQEVSPEDEKPQFEEKVESKEPIMMTVSKEQWDHLQNELKEYKDKNLRILAESENTRKRLQKEKAEMQAYAKENLVCEFLTPIDHFATALSFKEQQTEEVKNWMMGFEMILTQLKDILNQNEVRPIESVGHPFDPYFHEAMETEETSQYSPNTVIQEYVKGYMMGERVIRPAKVKVAKQPTASNEENQIQEAKKSKETINQKEG